MVVSLSPRPAGQTAGQKTHTWILNEWGISCHTSGSWRQEKCFYDNTAQKKRQLTHLESGIVVELVHFEVFTTTNEHTFVGMQIRRQHWAGDVVLQSLLQSTGKCTPEIDIFLTWEMVHHQQLCGGHKHSTPSQLPEDNFQLWTTTKFYNNIFDIVRATRGRDTWQSSSSTKSSIQFDRTVWKNSFGLRSNCATYVSASRNVTFCPWATTRTCPSAERLMFGTDGKSTFFTSLPLATSQILATKHHLQTFVVLVFHSDIWSILSVWQLGLTWQFYRRKSWRSACHSSCRKNTEYSLCDRKGLEVLWEECGTRNEGRSTSSRSRRRLHGTGKNFLLLHGSAGKTLRYIASPLKAWCSESTFSGLQWVRQLVTDHRQRILGSPSETLVWHCLRTNMTNENVTIEPKEYFIHRHHNLLSTQQEYCWETVDIYRNLCRSGRTFWAAFHCSPSEEWPRRWKTQQLSRCACEQTTSVRPHSLRPKVSWKGNVIRASFCDRSSKKTITGRLMRSRARPCWAVLRTVNTLPRQAHQWHVPNSVFSAKLQHLLPTLWNLQLLSRLSLPPCWVSRPTRLPCGPRTFRSSPQCLPAVTLACHLKHSPRVRISSRFSWDFELIFSEQLRQEFLLRHILSEASSPKSTSYLCRHWWGSIHEGWCYWRPGPRRVLCAHCK